MNPLSTTFASGQSKRGAERFVVDLGSARMLGSLSRPSLSFEYLLADVSSKGSAIIIPPDCSDLESFRLGCRLHTHLPFRFGEEFRDVGEVVRCEQREEGLMLGVHLTGRVPLQYPVFLEFNQGDASVQFTTTTAQHSQLFHRVLKDAYFLKRGILIYLDHLIPIFGRAATVRRRLSGDEAVQHYQETRGALIRSLEEIQLFLKKTESADFDAKKLDPSWDWNLLRRAVTVDFALENLARQFKTREVFPFLRSIRLLDHRLYTNFNTLIAIHHLG